ncbi:MAG: hypothetical protein FJ291_29350 [Planctomycetes bacterium]|nr:hypothetical protein [Planctomycetota bacterium]
MMRAIQCVSLLCIASAALAAELWWERGADTWYYKDDWRGLALEGSRAYSKTFELPDGSAGGWIVVWGDRGYALKLNGKPVGDNVDGGLIDDYDLKPFIEQGAAKVTLLIEGSTICAEGELIDAKGKRLPFATGDDWQTADGKKPRTRKLEPGPSHGAFHRAHNGRIMSYNDAERGKAAIARCLARIQKLNDQSLFLMRRLRPPEQILSFDTEAPWRNAERMAAPLVEDARSLLKSKAIPAQRAGDFARAIPLAEEAMLLTLRAALAVDRVVHYYRTIRQGIEATEGSAGDRFAWLNARELMGNDPARWPFTMAPSACAWIDLAGLWEFHTDPDNVGIDQLKDSWRKLIAPKEWERQGVMEDNLKSPGDCPYRLGDARTGDKPYNGFAWYRKSVVVPADWRGKKVVLATGSISNWGRVFVNGKAVGEGQQGPPSTREVPPDLLRFGEANLIAIQVYNHDNFGGIVAGPLALYVEGNRPDSRETPGPLSYTNECRYPTPGGAVRVTSFASAMSPAVVLATDGPALELRGWEAKGYALPTSATFAAGDGVRHEVLGTEGDETDGAALSENWVLLSGSGRDTLTVLERAPKSLSWKRNAFGGMSGTIAWEKGPVRAAILVMPEGVKLDEAECRWWARALRRYPVSATEMVTPGSPQTCRIKYHYLDLGGFGKLEPLTVAPVPMLFSYGLRYKHPGLAIKNARTTSYHSEHAPYMVVENTDTVEYEAPPVDRSKVMKGVGELFGKMKPEHNARGGLPEDVMFKRMGEWGFDHLRYAFAFHANWDLPLAKFMGGPIIEDNEAAWKRLDQLIEKTNAAGMQMMLCWFFNEDQPQADTGGAVRNSTRYWQARPEAQKNAFELWRRIAARYADKPEWAISYDFFNEPAYLNPAHWNQVIKELTAIIRSVDKRHMIVWESADGWAQPHWCLWMEPAKDPNVLYSFHHYGKHWGYAYDEYYPSYKKTHEASHIDPWLHAILFGIRHNVPIHCGEFGLSMLQPAGSGEAWLNDYLALFERFGIGWNWWNYSGQDTYRTGLAAGSRTSPFVPILTKWAKQSGWGASRRRK